MLYIEIYIYIVILSSSSPSRRFSVRLRASRWPDQMKPRRMQQYTRETVHTRSKESNHKGEMPTRRSRRSVSKDLSLQLTPSSFSSHLFAHQTGRAMIWAFRSCRVNLIIQGSSGSHCTVRRRCCNRSFRILCATELTYLTLPLLIQSRWCTRQADILQLNLRLPVFQVTATFGHCLRLLLGAS